MKISIIKLPESNNYAVVSLDRIVYALEASKEELYNLIIDEKKTILNRESCTKSVKITNNASIGLITSFDCNLRCIYCYSRGGDTKEIIPFEIGTSAIKYAAKNNNYQHLDLYLVGGGEPLLHFGLVSRLIDFAKSLCKSVKIHVVTNGTFKKEVLEWLIKHNADIRISYDGVMHDKQRPFANGKKSSKIIIDNIRSLVLNGLRPTIQCIITRYGLNTIKSTIEEMIDIGVEMIKIEPALSTDVSRMGKELEPSPKQYANSLLDAIRYTADSGYNLQIDTGYFSSPSDNYYCGVANNKTVTPHGLITACVEVSRPTDPYSDLMIYGSVEKNSFKFDNKKIENLSLLHCSKQLGGCQKCNLKLLCQGGCPMANIWSSGMPLKKSKFTCEIEHEFLPKILYMMAINQRVAKIVLNDDAKFIC